jgi:hypothetical protein
MATTTSPEEPAANGANNMMHVIDTATAASPTNDATMQPPQFTYMHEEVRVLLDEARIEGWKEGRKLRYEDGFEDGLEDGKEFLEDAKLQSHREGREEGYKEARIENGKVEVQKYQEGQPEGIKRGLQAGEYDKQQKWLVEGHGPGLCLSMVAHVCEPFHGAVLQEEAETQTDDVTTTSANTQTTSTCTIDALMQMAPNDKPPCLLNDVGMSTEAPSTHEMAIQANDEPRLVPQCPVSHPEISSAMATSPLMTSAQPPSAMTALRMTTTTSSLAPKQAPVLGRHYNNQVIVQRAPTR